MGVGRSGRRQFLRFSFAHDWKPAGLIVHAGIGTVTSGGTVLRTRRTGHPSSCFCRMDDKSVSDTVSPFDLPVRPFGDRRYSLMGVTSKQGCLLYRQGARARILKVLSRGAQVRLTSNLGHNPERRASTSHGLLPDEPGHFLPALLRS